MEFQTRYKRLPSNDIEPGGGPIIVETAGYIPAKERIERLIDAGVRLGEFRREMYDVVGDDPDDFSPLAVRNRGLDLAEASAIACDVQNRITKSIKRAMEKQTDEKQNNPPKEEKVSEDTEKASKEV